MSSFVEIDGKKFQSVTDAARLTGYSRDYIGRLAREQKIIATQVGRQWFVSLDSLKRYAESADLEMKDRQQKLSLERRREREVARQIFEKEQKRSVTEQRKKMYSRVLACVALVLGVGLGSLLNSTSLYSLSSEKQIASAPKAEEIQQAAGEFRVATGESVEQVSLKGIDFSQESVTISTLSGDGAGVLLLPGDGGKQLTEAEITSLFSDPIHLVKDGAGNQYVIRKTADGREERLPFAVVPVLDSDTQ